MNLQNKHDLELEQEQSWQGAVSDLAFLLIIFFILTASFSVTRILQLSIEEKNSTNGENTVSIHIELLQDESCSVDGTIIPLTNLDTMLTSNNNYIITIKDAVRYQSVVNLLDKFSTKNIYSLQLEL